MSQIIYWCNYNKRNGRNKQDGFYWCKRSVREFAEKDFRWIKELTIKRAINKLEEMGILVSTKLYSTKVDNTKAYRVDFERLYSLYGIRVGEVASDVPEVAENSKFEDIKKEIVINNSSPLIEEELFNENEMIKQDDDYARVLRKTEFNEFDLASNNQDKIYNVLQIIKKFIKAKQDVEVKGARVSYQEMLEAIHSLENKHIHYVVERLEETGSIYNVYKYTLSIIYDAVIQFDVYYQRKVEEGLDGFTGYEDAEEWEDFLQRL